MEGFELIAIAVFFLIGYWLVDFFWPKKKAEPMPASNAETWHEILGISPQASVDQIRDAYQRKSAEHHPDRVTPEAREAALLMTRKVNDAFEQAMRERS